MDEFGLVWLSSVWFDGVDFLKCSCSASQLSFTNLFFFYLNLHLSCVYKVCEHAAPVREAVSGPPPSTPTQHQLQDDLDRLANLYQKEYLLDRRSRV